MIYFRNSLIFLSIFLLFGCNTNKTVLTVALDAAKEGYRESTVFVNSSFSSLPKCKGKFH